MDYTKHEWTEGHQAASEPDFYGKWVSVKKSLPVLKRGLYSDWVLVADKRDGRVFVHQDRYDFEDNAWVSAVNPSYWMPLPQPPID